MFDSQAYQDTIDKLLNDQDDDWNPTEETTVHTNKLEFLSSDREIAEFSLEELRKFPRYLSDLTIKSNPSIISLDHYSYWAWTGAVAVGYPPWSGKHNRQTIRDLTELIQLILFGMRSQVLTQVRTDPNLDRSSSSVAQIANSMRNFTWINPGILSIPTMTHKIAVTMGFSILDGLIKAHCSVLDFGSGDLINPKELTWRKNPEKRTGVNFHDRIQIWANMDASPTVAETISHINDLQRYDPKIILNSMDGIEDRLESELSSTNHFLRLLQAQRNGNVHGHQRTRAVSSIVINLCCLLFWDLIKPDEFDRERSHAISEIASWNDKQIRNHNVPEAFLPLFRFED